MAIFNGTDGDDTFTGDDAFDVITGDAGDDTLSGKAGDDRIFGGDGHDILYGGTDGNTVWGGAGDDRIVESEFVGIGDARGPHRLNTQTPSDLHGGAGDDVITEFESAYGRYTGGTAYGGPGNDRLALSYTYSTFGGAGNDWVTVASRALPTTVDGGAEYDRLDTLSLFDTQAGVSIDLTPVWTGDAVTIGTLILARFETLGALSATPFDDFIILGSPGQILLPDDIGELNYKNISISLREGNDTLIAGRSDETVEGGDGDDTIAGGGGLDFLRGEAGADRLFGGRGDDALFGGDDDDVIAGDAGDDVLFGQSGADRLFGGKGDDDIDGGDGDDRLYGGPGDDTMTGGAGSDFMVGGRGADTFVFGPDDLDSQSIDTVGRFGRGDIIDLVSTDRTFTFIGTDAFSGSAGELRYAIVDRETLVTGDIDGDGIADFTIRLTGENTLGEADFRL